MFARCDRETGFCETATGKPDASSKSDHSENPTAERVEWPHNQHMSPATVHHVEVVFSIVRKIHEGDPNDLVDDLDVNMAVWVVFWSVRGHLGSSQFLARTCTVFFPVHERFWFCLGQVFVTQFCSFPLVLMARVDDGTDVLISLMPGTSSNSGSPDGSGLDLDEMGHRSGRCTIQRAPRCFCSHSGVDSQILTTPRQDPQ